MELLTAEIIKDQMVGQTAGHMASIPNSPIIFSMFQVYLGMNENKNYHEAFLEMLEEMVVALKERK